MKNTVRSTRQLADALGLSRWTVSRALNGHKGIHPRTVERVHAAAKTHGFAPSLLGRGLRSGQTDLVGVCVPDLVDYFLTDKVMRLQKAVAGRGLDILLQINKGTPESENAALERFAAMRCRGVVVVAPRLPDQSPGERNLAAAGIPMVRVDSIAPTRGRHVETDRSAGLRTVVAHLHALGHRNLATVAISPGQSYARQRLAGLRRGAREAGWDPDRHLHHWPLPGDAGEWPEFDRHTVSALVALNDRIAIRLLRWAALRGLDVPRDLSIVGFDNSETAALVRPSLTTLDPQPDLLMDRAVELLFAPEPAHLRVRPELIPRESTGPAPKKNRK